MDIKNIQNIDDYCDLLPISYKMLEHATGLVCGSIAENFRDDLYIEAVKLVEKYAPMFERNVL